MGFGFQLEDFCLEGLQGTGPPGQVRDMLHGMEGLPDLHKGLVEIRVRERSRHRRSRKPQPTPPS